MSASSYLNTCYSAASRPLHTGELKAFVLHLSDWDCDLYFVQNDSWTETAVVLDNNFAGRPKTNNTLSANPVSLALLVVSLYWLWTLHILYICNILEQLLRFVTLMCFSFDFYIHLQAIWTSLDVWYQFELVKNMILHGYQLFMSRIW